MDLRTIGAPAERELPGAGRLVGGDVAEDSPTPTSVYRYYDRFGVLIYAGITSRAIRRQREHNDSKEWWPFVVRQEVDHHPDRATALRCERSLIRSHRPPFNRQHNPGWERTRAAYLAFNTTQRAFDLADNALVAYQKIKDGGVGLADAAYDEEGGVAHFISEPIHPDLLASFRRDQHSVIFYNRNGTRLGAVQEIKVSGSVLLIHVSLRNTAPSELGHVIATVKYATATKPPQFKVTSLREISSPVVAVSA